MMREGSQSPPLIKSGFVKNKAPTTSPSTPPTPRRRKPSKMKPDVKLKCGACGQVISNHVMLYFKILLCPQFWT